MAEVEIREAKATWAQDFRGLGRLLRAGLGTRARAIHHIGSTAVPGLAAKDVIDVQVTVGDLAERSLGGALAALGFARIERVTADHLPPGATDPARWAKQLYKLERPRAVNLHVRAEGRPNAVYPLLFRDYLRAVPEEAAAYEAVKRKLAAEHPDDRGAYTDLKDPECDRIMERARRWAEQVGWKVPPTDE